MQQWTAATNSQHDIQDLEIYKQNHRCQPSDISTGVAADLGKQHDIEDIFTEHDFSFMLYIRW